MKKIKKLFLTNQGLFLVIILSCFPLIDLLNSGLPVTHDGTDHVARIANFYNALKDGVIFPRWGEYLNWGYGHPVMMFLYPFSSYFASLFHLFGFSYVDSLKLVFASGYIASGITMYLWAKKQFNDYFAVSSAVLYLYAPYRFVDMYVRGAIGEHMAFIFPPVILLFILLLFESKKRKKYLYGIGLAISTCLLLLSHNAISLMFLPIFAGYIFYLSLKHKDYRSLSLAAIGILYGFILSSFFTIPAFLEGKFTLRDIVTGDEYKKRFVDPISLLYGKWSYGITGQFSVQIGIIHLIGVITSFIFLASKKVRKLTGLVWLMFVCFVFSLFIMTSYSSPIYDIVTIFKKFQFPWRFLTLTVFTSSVFASGIFLVIKKDKLAKVLVFFIILGSLATTFTFWHAKEYKTVSDDFYNNVYYGTTDTGESAPIWSVRFMEKEADFHAEIIEGSGNIQEISRTSVRHEYFVTAQSERVRIRENTLYFPGWSVRVNGKETEVQFQDPNNRGLITYYVPKGQNNVVIQFYDTKLRILSNSVSVFGFLIIIVGCVFIYIKHGKKN